MWKRGEKKGNSKVEMDERRKEGKENGSRNEKSRKQQRERGRGGKEESIQHSMVDSVE